MVRGNFFQGPKKVVFGSTVFMTLEKHQIEAVFEVEIEHFLRREGPAAGRAHQLWGLLELCASPLQGVHGLLGIKDTHHPRALR